MESYEKYLSDLLGRQKKDKAEIMELFQIGVDTFYSRKNTGNFSLHEAVLLAKKYRLSLDTICGINNNERLFNVKTFTGRGNALTTVQAYIETLFEDLQAVKSFGLQKIFYAAKDLPLFCFFSSPILSSFKLHFWYYTIFETNSGIVRFDENWLPAEVLQKASELYTLYNSCNSVEIWNYETLNSTLHQVKYCLEIGIIRKSQANEILQELKNFIMVLNTNCQAQNKCGQGHLQILLDNSVLFDLGDQKIFYLPLHTLNFLSTVDTEVVEQTIEWFNKQIQASVAVSGVAQKERTKMICHYENLVLDCL
jgi:hypothetical protein